MIRYNQEIRKALEAKELKMKTLSRIEVRKAFNEIIEKYGKPTNIHCEEQLISAIVSDLSDYDETNIIFEYGRFVVSPSINVCKEYADDYTFIGTVKQEEWFTKEQIKALHELAFGYQF